MPSFDVLIPLLGKVLPNPHTDDPEPSLCLRACVGRYLNALEEDNAAPSSFARSLGNIEVVEAHVSCCLHFLTEMAKTSPVDDKPVFSVYHTQQLTMCAEFVVALAPLGLSKVKDIRGK